MVMAALVKCSPGLVTLLTGILMAGAVVYAVLMVTLLVMLVQKILDREGRRHGRSE